jgi:hypothetical protein
MIIDVHVPDIATPDGWSVINLVTSAGNATAPTKIHGMCRRDIIGLPFTFGEEAE